MQRVMFSIKTKPPSPTIKAKLKTLSKNFLIFWLLSMELLAEVLTGWVEVVLNVCLKLLTCEGDGCIWDRMEVDKGSDEVCEIGALC